MALRHHHEQGLAEILYLPFGEDGIVVRARAEISAYEDMAELIRLGAYRAGTNPDVDRAIKLYPHLEWFLKQAKDERANLSSGYAAFSS